MFDNIGGKIKTLATVVTWIGIIISVIAGIIMMFADETWFFLGILVAVFGSLGAWIGSFLLYGFGELIEKVTVIARNTSNQKTALSSCEQTSIPRVHVWCGNCQMCGKENVLVSAAVIVDDMGTQHKDVCNDCFKKYNCKPEK